MYVYNPIDSISGLETINIAGIQMFFMNLSYNIDFDLNFCFKV